MLDPLAVRRPVGRSTASEFNGRRRSAFTLAEVLITVALVALLAGAIVPTIYGRLQAARADAIIGEMQSLENGIMLFYRDIGRYPRRLDLLNSLAANDPDACGASIVSNQSNRFRGPYINRNIVLINPGVINKYVMATGDTVDDLISRNLVSTATGSVRVLQISVQGIDASVLTLIDYKVDGANDTDQGKIIIQSGILKWTIPIKLGAC